MEILREAEQTRLYRGVGGRSDRTPHLYAVGEYWTPDERLARTYGPRVLTRSDWPKHPYRFRFPKAKPYYTELQDEFGTADAMKITELLHAQGYDGLIVGNVTANRRDDQTGEMFADNDSTEVIFFSKQINAQVRQSKKAEETGYKQARRAAQAAENRDRIAMSKITPSV